MKDQPSIQNLSVSELLAAGKAIGQHVTPPEPFAPYAIVPGGYDLKPLPRREFAPLPDHIRQLVRLDDAESFISYVKLFSTYSTRIFAAAANIADLGPGSAGGAEFVAILDYHASGKEAEVRRAAHVARYPVGLSVEFSTWLQHSGVAQNQLDFVSFIEANAPDVVKPDSATLMELALNFEAKSNVNFQSKVDRTTGGRNLTFQEQVEAGAPSVGQVRVPDTLTLSIPIFEGGKKYEIVARMEYRPQGGALRIFYHLQRPHDVFRKALKELRQEIEAALEMEILVGHVSRPTVSAFNDEK